MKPNRDVQYLTHILESIQYIREWANETEDAFWISRKSQSAILRELQTMLESCQKLSPDTKGRFSEIDWASISGMRNVLVHEYMSINLERVWQVVQTRLDEVESMATQRLAEIEQET